MAEVENNTEGPGKLLAAARKKAGQTKSDIAEKLNLSAIVIGQLESDHYTDDIPDAFLRGYLRTYARVVKQDEEQVIALYSQFIGRSIVQNYYVPSVDVPPLKIQLSNDVLWVRVISISVVIVILVLGWMAYSKSDTDDKSDKVADGLPLNKNAPVVSTIPLEKPKSELPKAELSTITQSEEVQPIIDLVEEDNAEIPRGFIDSPVLSNAELAFSFIDSCWIQVIDSNDEVLAVGLKSPGRRFIVSGVPPIKVVLGKPRAVSIQFNNHSVDLSIYPASQIARFTLGGEESGVQ